jgi:hypothetical protein
MLLTGTNRIFGREARFAYGGHVVSVVLAPGTFQAVGTHQLGRDDACIAPEGHQLACPVVGAGTGFHGNQTAPWQPRAPGHELLALQRPAGHHASTAVHRMHLDHALGQVGPHAHRFTPGTTSCNLLHGLPLSQASD